MIKNEHFAIFGGGGIRGLAYCGAFKALEEFNIKLSGCAGSSIGSVFATLLTIGYTYSEIYQILSDVSYEMFIDINMDIKKELAISKASSILSDYLAFFNAQTEQGISCSEPVVLAVISSLGNLGNKIAFDNLLYVGYLSYSDEIIEASRVALAGLKF